MKFLLIGQTPKTCIPKKTDFVVKGSEKLTDCGLVGSLKLSSLRSSSK